MQCESKSVIISPIHIGNIDSFDNIGDIGNIGDIEDYCQREHCVSISAYSSGCLLHIGDFETFYHSPLRGNFAS